MNDMTMNEMTDPTIEKICEQIDALIDEAAAMPFSSKKMVDAEKIHDFVDQIRLNMPKEIRSSKDITREKKNIIAEANKEAEKIITQAKEDARKLVAQQEILKQAAQYAKEEVKRANDEAANIIAEAQNKEKAIRAAMVDNITKTLSEAAAVLSKNLDAVNDTKTAVSKIAK